MRAGGGHLYISLYHVLGDDEEEEERGKKMTMMSYINPPTPPYLGYYPKFYLFLKATLTEYNGDQMNMMVIN